MKDSPLEAEAREVLISCAGFDLEGLCIPPFQLHVGEVVTLEWPLCLGSTEQHLTDIFIGEIAHDAVLLQAVPHQIRISGLVTTLFGHEQIAAFFDSFLPLPFRTKFLSWLPWGYTISSNVLKKDKHPTRIALPKPLIREVAKNQHKHPMHLHAHGADVLTAVAWALIPQSVDLLVFDAAEPIYKDLKSLLHRVAAIEISKEVTRTSPPKKWFRSYPGSQILKVTVRPQNSCQ